MPCRWVQPGRRATPLVAPAPDVMLILIVFLLGDRQSYSHLLILSARSALSNTPYCVSSLIARRFIGMSVPNNGNANDGGGYGVK